MLHEIGDTSSPIEEEESNLNDSLHETFQNMSQTKFSQMPHSSLKLRQSQTHNFTGSHESRNLQKELVLTTKKTNPVVERQLNEAFKINNKGLYDIKNMFKAREVEEDEATDNVKDVMFQMLYDEQKYGLAQKQKELFGTTKTVAQIKSEHSRPQLIERVSEGIQKAALL